MAAAKPANQQVEEPVVAQEVDYIGKGADKVKFEADPKAKKIRVYDDGFVVIDY